MQAATAAIGDSPPEEEAQSLSSPSFLGLLVTQFLGALNDNIFRYLAMPIGMYYFGEKYKSAALALGAACFVLPLILLAAPAGYLADRFSRADVIRKCKIAEIVLMLLGILAIASGNVTFLFITVALVGAQAALFGPSKYSIIPDLLPPSKISIANGIISLSTVAAIIFGAGLAYILYDATGGEDGRPGLWIYAAILLSVAVAGWAASLFIRKLPPANPSRHFPWDMASQTFRDVQVLARSRAMLRVACGSAFFWSLGALAQMNVDLFAESVLRLSRTEQGAYMSLLLAVLAIGVGTGNILAGAMSRGHIELGIVPLAASGISMSATMLFTVPTPTEGPIGAAYLWTCAWLFLLGTSAGMFDIPLTSYLQHRSPSAARGSILAASNFITYSGVLTASAVFFALRAPIGPGGAPLLDARGIFLFAGFLTTAVAVYAFVMLPQATLRFAAWLVSSTIYRVRLVGLENIPARGGALLVANHVSWLDGILLMLVSSRPIRMMVYADYVKKPWIRGLARLMGAIPVEAGRKSVVQSIATAREAIAQGELVCIFPEGQITRTGQMSPFKPGALAIVDGTDTPIVPIYLDGLWGSIFSFHGGKFFWKRPRQWPYPVTIFFGPALKRPQSIAQVQRAVEQLGFEALQQRKAKTMILPRAFLRACRSALRRSKIADSLGMELTGGSLLMRTLILRRILRRILAADEQHVGILLPPSVPGVLANAAVSLDRRIAVNLNYTMSSETVNYCIRLCGIRHVLTTRKLMERLPLDLDAELVFVEDFRNEVTTADKAIAAVMAYATPVAVLERMLGLTKIKSDDVLTVIFTSGSTGEPKGVMLTHQNVGSNIEAIDELVTLSKNDVLAGVLPFFHSLGYTTTMWTILALAPKGVYHTNPLEAKQVGDLCRKHRANILIATPTFLRNYLKRCQPEDFAALELVLAGAERLPPDLSDAFENKFGVRPVEGYGTTELSPLVAVNIPQSRAASKSADLAREGTVGRPIPNVAVKIVDPETGEELGREQSGLLWVKGPNVMKGYYKMPEKTAEVIRDGWYNTGDIAEIDRDGFIRITGRQSRFSKIGGEMVPHVKIEETLQAIVAGDSDELRAVVTAVPDERKGERLVIMHTKLDKSPETICKELAAAGLPNLWIPSQDSFFEVDELPVLGTGKLDLKGMQQLALEKVSAASKT